MLPTDLNGFVLLFHINQHLRSGLGLRQIIDWMMFVNVLPEEVWTGEMLPVIKDTGMEKLASTVTAMCREYLGLEKGEFICRDVDMTLCRDLMEYILDKGNFGGKSGENGKISSVYLAVDSPIKGFKRLQMGGLGRWEAAKKHKILRPFAWVYQSGRIIGELIRNKKNHNDMKTLKKEGLRQREMIRRLGLNVDREV